MPSLRISAHRRRARGSRPPAIARPSERGTPGHSRGRRIENDRAFRAHSRSEEHTSELQSRVELVWRLLLEKKKTTPVSDGSVTVELCTEMRQVDWDMV